MNATQLTQLLSDFIGFWTDKEPMPEVPHTIESWAKWYAEKHPEPALPVSERDVLVINQYRRFLAENWGIDFTEYPHDFYLSYLYKSIPPAANEMKEKIEARINEIHLNPLPDGWTIREANRIIRELENLLKP